MTYSKLMKKALEAVERLTDGANDDEVTDKPYRWLDRHIAALGPNLALCLSEADFKAVCDELEIATPYNWVMPNGHAATHFFEQDGVFASVVCINDWQGRKISSVAGLLVHEAVHVWQRYAEAIGEVNPGAEQEAYAIQHIAEELITEYIRRNEENND